LVGRPAAQGEGGLTAFAYQGRLADSPDGGENLPIIYGAYESGRIAAWSTLSGQLLTDLEGHAAPVTSMQCCNGADGSEGSRPCLISASLDGSIRVWRSVEAAAFASSPGELGLTADTKEQPSAKIERISNMVELAFEPLKENRLKGVEGQNALALVTTFARELDCDEGMIRALETALTKSFTLRGGSDVNVLLEMDDKIKEELEELHALAKEAKKEESTVDPDDIGARCLFILDFGVRNPVSDFIMLSSTLLVAGSWDGRLRSLNLKSRTCSNIVEVKSEIKVTCLCAPTGQHSGSTENIYVGMEDGSIACWNFACSSGASSYEVLEWKAHAAETTRLEFTNYSGKVAKNWLVSASEDRTICIWAPEDGRLLKEFYGHTGGVLMLCYTPQERLLWSGSRDHSIRSWCLEEAETQLREQDAMENADVESRKAEIMFAKSKLAKPKKKAGKAGATSASPSPRSKSPKAGKRSGKSPKNKGQKKAEG